MEQELIKRLFELTVEGNLIALKKVVEKHPNIHLSDCWTSVIKYKDREHRFCSITKYSQKGYYSLLHQAATSGFSGHSVDFLKYFIGEKNFDPCIGTERGKHSETSLHLAARYGNIDAVKYFIEELHIDPSLPDKGDCTSLYYAAEGGQLSIVQYLVEKQHVDVLAKTTYGEIPLAVAIQWQNHDVVEYFLKECHVDPINFDNFSGGTALHVALRDGWGAPVDNLKYLIDTAKLDPSVKNEEGETALEYAKRFHGTDHPAVTYISQVVKYGQC